MINPILLCRLETIELEDGSEKLQIDSQPIPEGTTYKVLSYSQYQDYTIIRWEISIGEESVQGENLWRGTEPIASVGGSLGLGDSSSMSDKKLYPRISVWDAVRGQTPYNIAPAVAIALNRPENTTYL